MAENVCEVLIVGAGPTGLTLGCDLKRRGIPVRVIERSIGPTQSSRAVCMQARTLEMLDGLGVLEELLPQGRRLKGVNCFSNQQRIYRFGLNTEPTPEVPYPYLLLLEQHVTEAVLRRRLAALGCQVEFGVELERLSTQPDQVQCWLRTDSDEEHLRCSYVIGCDGAHSSVRRLSEIGLTSFNTDTLYRAADLDLESDLEEDEIYRFVEELRETVVMPLSGHKRYRVNTWERSNASTSKEFGYGALGQPPTLEEIEQTLERLLPGPFKVSNPQCLVTYHTGFGVAHAYRKDRVFLCGDAAHILPQSTAQGMNMGIQDALNLGWRLALVCQGDAPEEVLAKYEAERRPVAFGPLVRVTRDSSLARKASQFDNRQALDAWSQIDLNYRHCSLQPCTLPETGTWAGDRAPDGLLKRGDEIVDLYDVLTQDKHHLLIFCDGQDPELDRIEALVEELYSPLIDRHRVGLAEGVDTDVDRRLHSVYSACHGDLILIRPDGYIEIRFHKHMADDFLAYLSHHFIPRVPAT